MFSAINPHFLSAGNISNTLAFTVELGLIALAMTLLMTSGEFDLSVGSVFGFSAGADVDAVQHRRACRWSSPSSPRCWSRRSSASSTAGS